MRPTGILGLLLLAGCVTPVQDSALTADTPLPANLAVQVPAADVPSQLAAFSGAWVGRWGNGRLHTLVVERVDAHSANVVYSWGPWPGTRVVDPAPGFRRVSGEFTDDGALHATTPTGADVTYWLANDGRSLNGRWQRNVQRFEGVFQHRDLASN